MNIPHAVFGGAGILLALSQLESAHMAARGRIPVVDDEPAVCAVMAEADVTGPGSRLSREELTSRIASVNNTPAYGANLQPDEMQTLVDFLSHERRTQ